MAGKRSNVRRALAAAACASVAAAAGAPRVHAFDIIINFNAAASDFPSYDPTGAGMLSLFQYAESFYEGVFLDPGTLTLSVWYTDLPGNRLAQQPFVDEENGIQTEGQVQIDTPRDWYIDPSPDSDVGEYALTQTFWRDLDGAQRDDWFNDIGAVPPTFEVGYEGEFTNPALEDQFDMLSTILHEVGHALGMNNAAGQTIANTADGDYGFNPAFLFGQSLDAETADINPGDNANIAHLDNPFAMMDPSSGTGERSRPSHTDLFAMASGNLFNFLDVPRREYYGGTNFNTNANWSGHRVPGGDDDAFVRHGGTTTLSANASANDLLVDEGTTVNLGTFELTANDVTVGNTGSAATIQLATGGDLNVQNLNLNGGRVLMQGGNIRVDEILTINAGGELAGRGTVSVYSFLANHGLIRADGGTLILNKTLNGSPIVDLDGSSDTGTVEAIAGSILIVDVPTLSFHTTMSIAGLNSVNADEPFIFTDSSTLNFNGVSSTSGGFFESPETDVHGTVNVKQLGQFLGARVLFSGTTNVLIPNGKDALRLNAQTTYKGGSYTGGGLLDQNAFATVEADTSIDVRTYDMDGISNTGGVTVKPFVTFTVNSLDIEQTASDGFDGTARVDGGFLEVNTGFIGDSGFVPDAWTVDAGGLIELRNAGIATETGVTEEGGVVRGSPIEMWGRLFAVGPGNFVESEITMQRTSQSTLFSSGADLDLRGQTTWRGGTHTGSGVTHQTGSALVTSSTTLGYQTYDWDGDEAAPSTTVVLPDSLLTINATAIDTQVGDGHDGTIGLVTAGLRVNVPTFWFLDGTLTMSQSNVLGSALVNRGRIEGTGNIQVPVVNGGTISPGLSTGQLLIDVVAFEDGSELIIELAGNGGTAGVDYDQLQVDQDVTINPGAAINLSLLGAFVPTLGETFTVVTSSTAVVGTFDHVLGANIPNGLALSVLYGPKRVLLRAITAIVGDYNANGQVEQGDLDLVLANWGVDTDASGAPAGWFQDLPMGLVEQAELDKVLQNWGATAAPAFPGGVVPEPAAGLMLALVGLGRGLRHRCRATL